MIRAQRAGRFLLAGALALAGCVRTVNTLPPVTRPDAPIQEQTLYVPPGLEIRSVDYEASLYSDVSGGGSQLVPTTTSPGGRAFVKVFAVDRKTGEQVLLLYEDITRRPRPIAIIRFREDAGARP
ncbi:MAG: hypothetical protein ACJ8J0_16695 [Longimicrobiaceae bacterium]